MPKYQILSLDGGGIRGLLTVRILERLAKTPGLEGVFENVYLIAGNSSGALIALGMSAARTVGKPTKTVLAEMGQTFHDGGTVFGFGWPIWLGGLWLYGKYGPAARKHKVESTLQTIKLRELGTKVVITTFDLDNHQSTEEKDRLHTIRRWEPKIFHNFMRTDGRASEGHTKSDRRYRASDVALYSTAAPTYFPTVDGYIDGAVYANNPSMCALAQMFDYRYEPIPKPAAAEISMFSIGAGRNARYIEGDAHRWGAIKWGLEHYIEMTTEATVGVADYQCRQLLGDENYHRREVEFEAGVTFQLDDVGRVDEIEKIARDVNLTDDIKWLKHHWVRPKMVTVSDVTSKHLAGASELTCLMPIRAGFVDVFETHTYATRLRILLRTLHGLRQGAREVATLRVLPDIVDRVRSIHSFRLAILGNSQLLLAVNFDRAWEPYMRVVWREFGPLLDLILVNCEGYDGHQTDQGFEPFSEWIRAHQVDTGLFYVNSAHTVDDVEYLTELEKLVRREGGNAGFDERAAKLRIAPENVTAGETVRDHPRELVEQGLVVLAAFYKLRELYRDGTPDGSYLNAAAAATLRLFTPHRLPIKEEQRAEYRNELKWFESIKSEKKEMDSREPELHQIQGGIVEPYRRVTHGCLLLARIEDVELARKFLRRLVDSKLITHSGVQPAGGISRNVAFTIGGLKRLGVSDEQLRALPKEFREGMESRAGMLGDIGANHPDNWQLPAWNWDDSEHDGARLEGVRLSTVDLVIELRGIFPKAKDGHTWRNHPLHDKAHELVEKPDTTGIRVLSVEPMLVLRDKKDDTVKVVEHFGYLDNVSQPRVDGGKDRDQVRLGDIVLGYSNSLGDPSFAEGNEPLGVADGRTRGNLLDNGTFLVVRKLEQHVGRLREVVKDFLADPQNRALGLTEDQIYGKLMGRDRNGVPATGGDRKDNEFTYADDDGSRCPLHAHIRRGNPRVPEVPRIARRGMSYGPRFEDSPDAERGIIFLAYNASIAEQYEVIQRWMTGGNSTRSFSGCADPFLRVPEAGSDNLFLIPHGDRVVRMNLGNEPFVSLRWGMYLFVPSLRAIARLAEAPKADRHEVREVGPEVPPEVLLGQTVITSLQTDEEWEAILSDSTAISSGRTAAVSAAIRRLHDGVIRTSSRGGLVLVANHQLAMEVLTDDHLFSVSEYRMRMQESIGDIYLGHDSKDEQYKRWSRLPNEAIGNVSEVDAFRAARAETAAALTRALERRVQETVRLSLEDIIDDVLGKLSAVWFGIPDGCLIKSGGKPTAPTDTTPHCPFHYLAPSRYIFSSPRPRSIVTGAGEAFGERLREATKELARQKIKTKEWPATMPSITRAVWETSKEPDKEPDVDLFARLMVGVMEGFLPTVYGNFYKTMYLWLGDDTFWRVQQNLLLANANPNQASSDLERVRSAVLPAVLQAMQARPVPDMLYRTATRRCLIGNVVVEPDDRVVVLVGSVTQELAARGETANVYPVFGGDRSQPGHPTHACPGYEMAIGVMLGAVSAVLEAGAYAATASPLVVNLRPLASVASNRGMDRGEASAAG